MADAPARTLVFEIGTEEIPSVPLYAAVTDLRSDAEHALKEARLLYADLTVQASPRRIALTVTELAERAEDVRSRVRGPAAKAAFDAHGRPTRAAEGFARSRGVDVASLVVESSDGGEYVFAVVEEAGRPAAELLPDLLARLAEDIDWPRSMRWGSGETRFSRPVRWLLALYGADVVPVRFAGLTAGRLTWGHRFLAAGPHEVASAEEYPLALDRGLVVVDAESRARGIEAAMAAAAAAEGAEAVVPETTFAEVVNLVESPTVAVGRFDEEFLVVPREVLETAMESHQRYFPLQDGGGRLLNAFVVVHNGDPERTEGIVRGHERVIRARLADAAFFYTEDLKIPLADRLRRLEEIVFQERLGTMADKARRVERLAGALAEMLDATPEARAYAMRAGWLAKADLVSGVVVEFPSLQGVMGRYYALAAGEDQGVAEAILEHYRPRFAGDEPPASTPGKLVSMADKLDTLAGIFAIGLQPTGSADPYGLRRAAIGVLSILLATGARFSLARAVDEALGGYGETLAGVQVPSVREEVVAFVAARLEGMLRERGHAYDTVDAVLAVAGDDPADAEERAAALTSFRSGETAIEDLSVAYTRARNLSDPGLGVQADPQMMGAEELALFDALAAAEERATAAFAGRDYAGVLGVLAELRGPIDAFFDAVLVMDPDETLRVNRLRLLNRFVALFSRFADISKLAG
ncbi:MAG: glycine--tRNA ligase subunit beta [Coriobacteriia bacterium]|nr:glycine--tRNA ligase subunit beta [Coriobacteriia bacterium]